MATPRARVVTHWQLCYPLLELRSTDRSFGGARGGAIIWHENSAENVLENIIANRIFLQYRTWFLFVFGQIYMLMFVASSMQSIQREREKHGERKKGLLTCCVHFLKTIAVYFLRHHNMCLVKVI